LRWPRDTLYQLKLALTSPTGCGSSVGIVRLRTKTTEFFFIHHHSYMITYGISEMPSACLILFHSSQIYRQMLLSSAFCKCNMTSLVSLLFIIVLNLNMFLCFLCTVVPLIEVSWTVDYAECQYMHRYGVIVSLLSMEFIISRTGLSYFLACRRFKLFSSM
jgi:hypothetical protein